MSYMSEEESQRDLVKGRAQTMMIARNGRVRCQLRVKCLADTVRISWRAVFRSERIQKQQNLSTVNPSSVHSIPDTCLKDFLQIKVYTIEVSNPST